MLQQNAGLFHESCISKLSSSIFIIKISLFVLFVFIEPELMASHVKSPVPIVISLLFVFIARQDVLPVVFIPPFAVREPVPRLSDVSSIFNAVSTFNVSQVISSQLVMSPPVVKAILPTFVNPWSLKLKTSLPPSAIDTSPPNIVSAPKVAVFVAPETMNSPLPPTVSIVDKVA